MLPPQTVAGLIDRIERSWAELDQAVATLSDSQMAAAGPDGWAIKDHLMHLASWEKGLAALLGGRDGRAAMGVPYGGDGMAVIEPNDFDELNERLYALHRNCTPKEARALLRQGHEEVRVALRRLADDDIRAPLGRFYPGNTGDSRDQPLIWWIADCTFEHVDQHLQWIRRLTSSS